MNTIENYITGTIEGVWSRNNRCADATIGFLVFG